MNDWLYKTSLGLGAFLSAALTLGIALFLLFQSGPFISVQGVHALMADPSWHPAEQMYNLLPMVAATVVMSVLALALALPVGLILVVYARFYAPKRIGMLLRRFMELLAGIPSVVYGFWALSVLVPLLAAWQPPGQNLLAAGLVLALMILPSFSLLAESSLLALPVSILDAGRALGLSRFSLIRRVALPAARRGLATGGLLALGRALGETMAVLMVAGNAVRWPSSLFQPVRALSANIALEMAYAEGEHRHALFASGLILLSGIVFLILISQRIQREPTRT